MDTKNKKTIIEFEVDVHESPKGWRVILPDFSTIKKTDMIVYETSMDVSKQFQRFRNNSAKALKELKQKNGR